MTQADGDADPTEDERLERLLGFLRDSRGFDFTGYKRPTLRRRIAKRMEATGSADYAAYHQLLEVEPVEFAALFDTVLINVTSFFRDGAPWEALREAIETSLVPAIPEDEPIRVWSAGCASGEEPYTLAMLLCEVLGEEQFLERVKIYATDVDEAALQSARVAVFSGEAVAELPEGLAARYFDRIDGSFAFRKDLRRAVVFGRNDLVRDAPISRIDLLTCRNTLMYFNAETQGRILERLHFSLNDRGLMLLGKSEMLTAHSALFSAVDLKRRLFRKVPRPGRRTDYERLHGTLSPLHAAIDVLPGDAFETAPVAQMVVDADAVLVAVNAEARKMLWVDRDDIGRSLHQLDAVHRPVELRGPLAGVLAEGRAATLPPSTLFLHGGERVEVEVRITPLHVDGKTAGAALTFTDVTEQRRLLGDVEAARTELENAYEELQSTVEELETTNEELQSTNEELETTNEELQSTNEELETMNEELQSTNEEIATVNDELRTRSTQLDDANEFLETIMSTLGVAVVLVDRGLAVQLWNGQAQDMWGLRADEVVGRQLLGLDIGLPLDGLLKPIHDALDRKAKSADVSVAAVNRRGRHITCRITVLPLHSGDEVTGAAMMMVDDATA